MKYFYLSLLLISSLNIFSQSVPIDSDIDTTKVYTFAEQMPEYPGGKKYLIDKFKSVLEITCPSSPMNNRIILQFVVETDGKTSSPKILRSVCEEADKKACEIVQALIFIPGTQMGKPVRTRYVLPINLY